VSTAPTINQAKALATQNRAIAVLVIQIQEGGMIGGASYGHTRASCDMAGRLLDAIVGGIGSGSIDPDGEARPEAAITTLDRGEVVEWVAQAIVERVSGACGQTARHRAGSWAKYTECAARIVRRVEEWAAAGAGGPR
jgi:hypothetical protein